MYGSDEVQRLLDVWGRESGALQHADEVISRAENAAGSDPELERYAEAERCEIEEYKRKIHYADDTIRAQMSAELAGEPESSAVYSLRGLFSNRQRDTG